jgi:hypothetical protein
MIIALGLPRALFSAAGACSARAGGGERAASANAALVIKKKLQAARISPFYIPVEPACQLANTVLGDFCRIGN